MTTEPTQGRNESADSGEPGEGEPKEGGPGESQIDEATIRQYFRFLGQAESIGIEPEKEIFSVAYLYDSGPNKGNVPGLGTFHGTVSEIIGKTRELNEGPDGTRQDGRGWASLHTTINQTNLSGRRTANIEACRVLVVDLDGVSQEVLDRVLGFNPHAVVQSSEDGAGKFHIYWKIKPGSDGLTLREWQKVQLAIAFEFQGDLNLDQLAKTIRVPGVPRVTKAGWIYRPRLRIFADGEVGGLTRGEIQEKFPFIDRAFEAAKEKRKLHFKQVAKLVRQAEESGFEKLSLDQIAATGRNNCLYWTLKKRIAKYTPGKKFEVRKPEISGLAAQINASFSIPLDEREVESTVESALSHGAEAWGRAEKKYKERLGKGLKQMEEKLESQGSDIAGVEHGYVNGAGAGAGAAAERVAGAEGATVEGSEIGTATLDLGSFQYDFEDVWLSGNSFSDIGLSARVIQRFSDKICRIADNMYAYDRYTHRWVLQQFTKDYTCELVTFVKTVLLDLRTEDRFLLEYATDKDGFNDRLFKKALFRFESPKTLNGVIKFVKSSSRIMVLKAEDFDADPDLLYVKNGLLDLQTGSLREVTAQDRLMCQTQVEYVPGATCPGWDEFLAQIYEGDMEMISFMQEVFGYSLQGTISEQVIFCHYGTGANGKSKLLSALDRLMSGYATTLAPDDMSLGQGRFAKPFERVAAKLEGKRVVILDDLETAEKWSETTVKNLTAPKVRARAEYEVSREIVNRAKVHLGMNTAPAPQSENHGLLRRLCIIPYTRRFSADTESSLLIDAMIERELSGILNWAIEGYSRWKKRGGLMRPAACKAAVEEYQEEYFNEETAVKTLWEKAEEKLEYFQSTVALLKEYEEYILEHPGSQIRLMNTRRLGVLIKNALNAKEGRYRFSSERVRGFYLISKSKKNENSQE